MAKVKKLEGYRCLLCDSIHETEEEVQECCFDEKQEEGTFYQCQECYEFYDDKDEAQDCCKK